MNLVNIVILHLSLNKSVLKNSIIFAEVEDWNIEDIVLRENEILINKPFNSLIGANNSQIVEDEYGFKYRKAYTTQKEKDAIFWKCSKINRLNCKCQIKTKGGIIVLQRYQHNHDAEVYQEFLYK